MALRSRRSKRRASRARKSEERIRQLAPLESKRTAAASQNNGDAERDDAEEGILRSALDTLPLSSEFVEADDRTPWWQPGTVVLVVLGLALAFIAFLTWQIAAQSRWVEDEGWKIEMKQAP
jgi:hypothetical protein